MKLRPIVSEKAVMKIEMENVLTFETEMKSTKDELKKEIEKVLGVKVDSLRTQIRDNKKKVYVKLNKKDLAMDIATKIGMM